MKNYPRIFARVFGEPWAITPQMHQIIRETLAAKLSGEATAALSEAPPRAEPLAFSGASIAPAGDPYEGLILLTPQIACVPVFGIIGKHLSYLETMCGGCDLDTVCLRLHQAQQHPTVRRIVMIFDTPGGAMTGLPETAKMMRDMGAEKPIDAYSETGCYSAGYYLASQAGRIVGTPSSMWGSIGVIWTWISHTARMAKEGDAAVVFQGGTLKAAGLDGKEMTPDESALFQDLVDKLYGEFKATVTSTRPQVQEVIMQGRFMKASDAQTAGLIDEQVWTLGDLVAQIESELSQP